MATYPISIYPWAGSYRPRAEAEMTLVETGIFLRMTAFEQTIAAVETKTGGDVYKDSCLEFFFMPCPETDARYINCEANCVGTMHIGVGDCREGRRVLDALPRGMRPEVRISAGEKWSVEYLIPTEWIQSVFPDYAPQAGTRLRGNFYCCDESIHPHFGCWHEISAPQPDFHRPECFGWLVLESGNTT